MAVSVEDVEEEDAEEWKRNRPIADWSVGNQQGKGGRNIPNLNSFSKLSQKLSIGAIISLDL